jgi:hypothetical protein
MARAASRKSSRRSSRRSVAKRSTKRSAKRSTRRPAARRAPMKRMATTCSTIPVGQCSRVNPNCVARRAPGRKTKICVRRSGAATKGQVYQGPAMPQM